MSTVEFLGWIGAALLICVVLYVGSFTWILVDGNSADSWLYAVGEHLTTSQWMFLHDLGLTLYAPLICLDDHYRLSEALL